MSSGWLDTVRVVRIVVVMFYVLLMHFVRHHVGLRHCVQMDFISSQVMHFPRSTWIIQLIEFIAIGNMKPTILCAISAARATSVSSPPVPRKNRCTGENLLFEALSAQSDGLAVYY